MASVWASPALLFLRFYNYKIWKEAVNAQNMVQESLEAKTTPASYIFPNTTEVKIIERVDRYYEKPPGSGQY